MITKLKIKQLLFTGSTFIIIFLCCSHQDKIDTSTIEIEVELTVKHNSSQTIDSIIIINTGKTITTTGDSIYRIITPVERRRIDSLKEYEKRTGIPINPFSPGIADRTHQSFTLNENSFLTIVAYDTAGNQLTKIIDNKYSKGIYEVYYAIFSILNPGTYFLKMSSQMVEQYIKLKII